MSEKTSAAARKIAQPQDHKNGADGPAFIVFRDSRFTIPASMDDVDGEVLRYAADGDAYRMVHAVLTLKDSGLLKGMRPTVGDYKAISEQIAQAYGFDSAGN